MNIKKILSILLTLLIVLGMSGCGEEPVEEVDNISNGVEFFNSLSKMSEFESYTFAATISWTFPDFTEDIMSSMGGDGSYTQDSQADTVTDSATNLIKQILRKKYYVEGTVVKTSNGSDIAFTLYKNNEKTEKIIDMVIKGKDVYVNVKSIVNEFLEAEVVKNEYLLINVDGINDLGESINGIIEDIMRQSMATPTEPEPIYYPDDLEPSDEPAGDDAEAAEPVDTIAMPSPDDLANASQVQDDNAEAVPAQDETAEESPEDDEEFVYNDTNSTSDDYSYGNYGYTSDDPFSTGDTPDSGLGMNFELPKINMECLKTLITPLVSGIQKTFASAEFNVFSVDAQGYNVMEINQANVLAIVKNILTKYREDSQNLFTALQECVKQSGVSEMIPSFTQQELEEGLDDAIMTVQDAIDFDETDGISFTLNVKSKYSGTTFSGGIEFGFQQDATQLSFGIMTERTKDSSASVNAPSDYCTLTDFVSAVLPEAIAGLSSGDIMIEDPGDGEEHLSIFS